MTFEGEHLVRSWLARPSQTEPRILEWADRFGELVRLRTLKTFSGHTAYAVTVTDAQARGEKRGLLVAQPHAHEPAATAGMMNFMCQMLSGVGLDGEPAPFDRRRFLREIEVTFLPDGNPFGRSRAPEDFWDGRDASGQRFPRQGRWSRAVIQAWRRAGADPIADPRPLGYGEDQPRYFRACWPDIYRSRPAVTVEVQNNNPRTPPDTQRKLQETAIHTSLDSLLS